MVQCRGSCKVYLGMGGLRGIVVGLGKCYRRYGDPK